MVVNLGALGLLILDEDNAALKGRGVEEQGRGD
jgi:hypothetical protein